MNFSLPPPPRKRPFAFLLLCSLAFAGAAAPGRSLAAPDTQPGRSEVEPPADTERARAVLKKAVAEAEANLTAVTAEHDRLDAEPASDAAAKAKADCERRLAAAIRRVSEASALLRAAAVEPYMPAAERVAIRALPPAERLAALAARPAEEVMRVVLPEVSFKRVRLADFFDFFGDLAPLNLQPDWPAIDAAEIDPNTEISLQLKNVEVGNVLKLVLGSVKDGDKLRVSSEDNVTVVTTQAGLDASAQRVRRLAAGLADPRTKAVLSRRLPEAKFEGVGLSDVLNLLADVSGGNMFTDWKRLEAAGVDRNAPVSCRLAGVRFDEVLRLVAGQFGLIKDQPAVAVGVEEGVIVVSTPEALDAMAAARKDLDALIAKDDMARAAFGKRLPKTHIEGVALKDVCDYLKDQIGTPVEVDWDGLKAAGIPQDAPVNVRLNDVTAGEALLLMLDAAAGATEAPRVGFERGHVVITRPASK